MAKVEVRLEGGVIHVDSIDAGVELKVTDIDLDGEPEVIETVWYQGVGGEPEAKTKREYNFDDEEEDEG